MVIINENKQLQNMLKGKKAVFFDMDGTLLNTEPLHAQALEQTLWDLGISVDKEILLKKYNGKSDLEVYQDLKLTIFLQDFLKLKNIHLSHLIDNLTFKEVRKIRTKGILPFLHFLRKNNYILAVVSASEDVIVNKLLKKTKLDSFFLKTVSRHDTFISKPNPSPYLQMMRKLKLKTNEVLIFEDSKTGIMAAKNSGGLVVRINNHLVNSTQDIEIKNVDNFSWLINFNKCQENYAPSI
jgi:beta-phosphoglucomutase